MPHNNLPPKVCRNIINYAWSLFRKRKYFENITAGIKSEEFTFTKNGYHYHLHLLALCKYIDYQTIREIWTDCLTKAFAENKTEVKFNTSDGKAIIKCIKIPNTHKALKKMSFELTKYITKADSWNKIPSDDLLEIALTERFPRMFEIFGRFKETRQSIIVHKQIISDGTLREKSLSWRKIVWLKGRETYEAQLTNEFERTKSIRIHQLKLKFKYATFFYTPDHCQSWDNYV